MAVRLSPIEVELKRGWVLLTGGIQFIVEFGGRVSPSFGIIVSRAGVENSMATITDKLRTKRDQEVESALASVRMEGLEPSAEAKAIFQRYVDGELTSEQMDCVFLEYVDREYGSIRLPGNDRSQESTQHP